MNNVVERMKTVRGLLLVFISTLLFSFNFLFVYFINSTFLSDKIGQELVSLVYAASAIINIVLFIFTEDLLEKYGNFKLTIGFIIISVISLVTLAFSVSLPLILCAFIAYQVVARILIYNIDIFLEQYTPLNDTGFVRGVYLTMMNLPGIIAPLIVGFLLGKNDFWKVYLAAAAFLLPLFIIIVSYFRRFQDPHYQHVSIKGITRQFYLDRNVFDVFMDNFLLQLFYAWFAIYMPLYLYNYIGFSWSEIGIMFAIMLLPFIILQIPVGRLEDARHDEKRLLIIGFLVISIPIMIIPFVSGANFLTWVTLLFATRIGASIVEVSSEGYFFKHIKPDNANYISLFRLNRSLPYLILPIVSLLLLVMSFKYTFILLGLIMLLGIRYAFMLDNPSVEDKKRAEERSQKKTVAPIVIPALPTE